MVDETYSTEGPKCPNPECGRQYTADESYYFDEMNYDEETCDSCGETFDVTVYTETSWTCERRATKAPDTPAGGEALLSSNTGEGE